MNILTGQIKKTEGETYIFGEDCGNLSDEIYLQMGMVLERIGVFERLSCYQNLVIFCNIHNIDKKNITETLKRKQRLINCRRA